MLLVVARIGRAHGVNGEATIEVRTDLPEERFIVGSVLVTEPSSFGPLTITSVRNHNGTLLLGFKEVKDRTAVEKLRDVLLLADVDISEGGDEDNFHIQELLGCRVVTDAGVVVGIMTDLVQLPGQDLLAVDHNGREILIPFVLEIVPEIDVENKVITITPPEGLLDE
jgi:16S rRNA processing protein RimM